MGSKRIVALPTAKRCDGQQQHRGTEFATSSVKIETMQHTKSNSLRTNVPGLAPAGWSCKHAGKHSERKKERNKSIVQLKFCYHSHELPNKQRTGVLGAHLQSIQAAQVYYQCRCRKTTPSKSGKGHAQLVAKSAKNHDDGNASGEDHNGDRN